MFNALKRKFDMGFTVKETGTSPLTLNGSLGKKLSGYEVYGQSEQKTIDIDGTKYKIPEGYTLLEYTRNSEYFTVVNTNTGLTWNNITKVEAKIIRTVEALNGNIFLVSKNASGTQTEPYIGVRTYVVSGGFTVSSSSYTNNIATCEFTTTITSNIYIGSWEDSFYSGTEDYGYLKFYNSTTLVGLFYPMKNSSGVAGFYDFITNTFHSSEGTDSFTAGTEAPSPSSPVAIESCGDLVTDSSSEYYGKYKIPVRVTNSGISTTTNIYLDEPLRKVGDYADSIDYATGKATRNNAEIASYNGETITTSYISSTGSLTTGAQVVYQLATPTEEAITLPILSTAKGTNYLQVATDVLPSSVSVVYRSRVN